MTTRDIHLVPVQLPSDGRERGRFRTVNDNFRQLRDAIERLKLTGGLVESHGVLSGLGDDDHTQYHTDARALTWLGTRSTTDLPEGSNLYYTQTRFDTAFAAKDTGDLAEGSNLYYTDARVAAFLAALAAAHGDLLYYNGSAWVRLAPGTSGQVLESQGAGAAPQWVDPSSGGTPGTDFDLLTDEDGLVLDNGEAIWT